MGKPNRALKKAKKKHDESLFREFQMDSGQFVHCINVIISKDLKRCTKYVNEKLNRNDFDESEFQCLGKVFLTKEYCPILWLPSTPSTVEEQGTLAHELLHIVFEVTRWAGVRPSSDSEEIYTHLLKYYYRQFFSKCSL